MRSRQRDLRNHKKSSHSRPGGEQGWDDGQDTAGREGRRSAGQVLKVEDGENHNVDDLGSLFKTLDIPKSIPTMTVLVN